jgi:hypothetical protein
MSPSFTALTTKVESGSPYQLNHEQVFALKKPHFLEIYTYEFLDSESLESSTEAHQIHGARTDKSIRKEVPHRPQSRL